MYCDGDNKAEELISNKKKEIDSEWHLFCTPQQACLAKQNFNV